MQHLDHTDTGGRAADGGVGVVAVLGMHRSGTSCLTGCLEEAGLTLGEVHRRSPSNLKGNRESQTIMDLHEDVLAFSGGSWDHPPSKVVWSTAHIARRDEIITLHQGDLRWGFKDPRNLLTIDGWLEALPQLRLVAIFRHPSSVAASLRLRQGTATSIEDWMDLWLHYNRRLLDLHDRFDFPVLNFDAPPAGFLAAVDSTIDHLGFEPQTDRPEFFEDDLRHHHPSRPLPPALQRIYDQLESVAAS
jgi:hypothetical protein